MYSINSKNRERFDNTKVKILLICLISIGMISGFEFTGLYPIIQSYATNAADSSKPFSLNQHNDGSQAVAFQKQTTGSLAYQSLAVNNNALLNIGGDVARPVGTSSASVHPSGVTVGAKNAQLQVLANNTGRAAAAVTRLDCIGGLRCGFWNINVDGLRGPLLIQSIDKQGIINGSLFEHPITGSWDHISKKITFTETVSSGSNSSISYEYAGFYHDTCGMTQDRNSCLIIAGPAIPKGLPPEQAARQEFGWIASLNLFSVAPSS